MAVLLVLLVALGVRLSLSPSLPFANSEGVLFSWIGLDLAEGEGFGIAGGRSLSEARAWHMPLLPLSLSLTYRLLGTGLGPSQVPSLLAGMGTVILLILLLHRLEGMRTALLGALLAAVHPSLAFYSVEVVSEGLLTFFLLLSLLLLTVPSGRARFSAGMAAALAYLTRPLGVILLPAALLHLLRRKDRRTAGAFLVGFLLLALPWWAWASGEYGTALGPERNTLLQMYLYDMGTDPTGPLSFPEYPLRYHSLPSILSGLSSGFLRVGKSLLSPFDLPPLGGGFLSSLYLPLVAVPFVLGIGEERGEERRTLLLAVLGLGLLSLSWAASLLPPQDSTPFRYVSPFQPLLLLGIAPGLMRLRRYGRSLPLLWAAALLLSSLALLPAIPAHWERMEDGFYDAALRDLPADVPLLVSQMEEAEERGFREAHPLGKRDFEGIRREVEKRGIRYVVIDASSLHNDDQFLLVNHWFREQIPPWLEKVPGDLFPLAVYRVAGERET
jgi:4-amino-4-deoxy-L-arabinose transferase-like glycosyltransferase